MAIEHHLYRASEESLNEQQWGYYFTFDRGQIFARPMPAIARLMLLAPPATYRTSIENWHSVIRGDFETNRYTAAQNRGAMYLSARGDIRILQGAPSTIKVPQSYSRERFPRAIAASLSEFRDWCDAHGVRVIATAPNAVIPDAGIANLEHVAQDLRRELAAVGIDFIGDPAEASFPLPFFYDTSYHLNAAGRRIRTELLARRIGAALAASNAVQSKSDPDTLMLLFGWQDPLGQIDDTRFATADYRLWSEAPPKHPSMIDAAGLRSALSYGQKALTADETGLPFLQKAGFRVDQVEHQTTDLGEIVRKAHDRVLFYAFSAKETAAAARFGTLPVTSAPGSSDLQVGVCGFGRWSGIRRMKADEHKAQIEEFARSRIPGAVLPPYFAVEAGASAPAITMLKVQLGRYAVTAQSGGVVVVYDPALGMIEDVYFTADGVAQLGTLYRIRS